MNLWRQTQVLSFSVAFQCFQCGHHEVIRDPAADEALRRWTKAELDR